MKYTVMYLAYLSLNNSLVSSICLEAVKFKNKKNNTIQGSLHTGPTQFKTISADEHIAFSDDSLLTSATITPTSLTS